MFDFLADNHSNSFDYGNFDFLETLEPGSVAGFLQLLGNPAAGRQFMGQFEFGGSGISPFMDNGKHIQIVIDATAAADATTVWAVDATTHSFGITWDGVDVDYMYDGADDGNGIACNDTSLTNTGKLMIGRNERAANSGLDCQLGQIMVFDVRLSVADTALFTAGVTIPQGGSLRAWIKCTSDPDTELKSATAGNKTGAPTVVADAVDDYFPPSGGYTWLLAEYWLPLLLGSGLFGNYLKAENFSNLWRAMIPVQKCFMPVEEVTKEERGILFDAFSRRPAYGY